MPWEGPFGKLDGGGRGLGGCPLWPSQAERRDRRGTQVGTLRPGRWPRTVLRLLSSLSPEPSDHQCSPHCPELGALGNGVQHQPGQNCRVASARLRLPLAPGAFPCWLTPRTLSRLQAATTLSYRRTSWDGASLCAPRPSHRGSPTVSAKRPHPATPHPPAAHHLPCSVV